MGEVAERAVPDGTEFPWAQDLDGTWHLRPARDLWGDPETEIQAHGRCGAAFGSVHVSAFRPTPDPSLGERLCGQCAALVPPVEHDNGPAEVKQCGVCARTGHTSDEHGNPPGAQS